MSRQNTRKQILAMVALMFLGVIGLGAYVWFDEGRRPEAEEEQAVDAAERGARIFARNCRVCHGNNGLGRDGNATVIGPALNQPANTLAWRLANDNSLEAADRDAARSKLDERQLRFSSTIACGRNGTSMPPWLVEQGGSLNFSHIESLVALITTNAGDAWAEALELAHEEDEVALAGLEDALNAAEAGATDLGVAAAREAQVEAANGDVLVALQNALTLLRRVEIVAAVDEQFGQELAAAEESGDEAALEAVAAVMTAAEAEALGAAVDDALAQVGGDPLAALWVVRSAVASNALTDADQQLQAAQARVADGLPVATPAVSVTQSTCGQRSTATATPAAAAPEVDTSGFSADLGRGEELFFSNGCNVCHGDLGEGGIGPMIAGTQLAFSQVLQQYRSPREAMPAFPADRIEDEDVFNIWSWLKSLGPDQ